MVRTEMCRNYFFILVFAIFALNANGQELKSYKDTQVKFEVLSVGVMSVEDQIRKQSDNIGIDVSVRLRLSNAGRTTIYFYTYGNKSISLYSHTIKEAPKGIVWLSGLQSTSEKPLGIDNITLRNGEWLKLEPNMTIEWESFDSSISSREKHAKTFFMKDSDKGVITEVYSDFYIIPSPSTPK